MERRLDLMTIAGSDPSGAAGAQVDLQVFRDHGAHGWSALTSVIAQNTAGVRRVWPVEPEALAAQLDAVLDDVTPAAIKVGALPTAALVEVVARALREHAPDALVVVDPVLASGDGAAAIAAADVAEAIAHTLAPLCDVLTPNLPELAALSPESPTPIRAEDLPAAAAHARAALGVRGGVLLKSGHLPGGPTHCARDAYADPQATSLLQGLPTIDEDVRGTGCQLSSAIAARLGAGEPARQAIEGARVYLNDLLRTARQRRGAGRAIIVRGAR